MIAYIIRRLLLIIPTLLGIMTLNFFIIQIAPGGPVEQMIAFIQPQARLLILTTGSETPGQIARFLTERGIPVMAHIGLTPQSSHVMGGFKTQGRDEDTWEAHLEDARAVTEAGAFAVVLEGMVEPLAAKITKAVDIPTIGIGASAECDGQILVLEDMLGLNPWTPKFVKVYGQLGPMIEDSVKRYAEDVKSRAFPTEDEVYR